MECKYDFHFSRPGGSASANSAPVLQMISLKSTPFVVTFSFDEQFSKSEAIQALDTIHKTQSFASCNEDKENCRHCFQTARLQKDINSKKRKSDN